MKTIFYSLICLVILYIYIYSPALQLVNFGLDKIILVLSIIYIFYRKRYFLYLKLFKKELVLLFCIFVFSVLVMSLNQTSLEQSLVVYDSFVLLECLFVPFAVISFANSMRTFSVDKLLLTNGVLASLITIFLLLNPSLASFVKDSVFRLPDVVNEHFAFRGFGLSDGLLFGYPVVQGFLCSFIICGTYSNKKIWHNILLLPLIVSICVNARSGIIPICVAFLLVLRFYSFGKILKIALAIFLLVVLGAEVLSSYTNSQLGESMSWGLNTFELILDLMNGKDVENMDALTKDMVQIPHDFNIWLYGCGKNIFSITVPEYSTSDIGYCIRLMYGGIFYCCLWLFLIIYMFMRMLKANKTCALILFLSLVYMNWKSDFFVVTPASRFFFFIYVYCILKNKTYSVRFRKHHLQKAKRYKTASCA